MQTQQVNRVGGSLMYSVKSAAVKSAESSFDDLLKMQNTDTAERTENLTPATTEKKASAENVGQTKNTEQTVESPKTETTVSTDKKMGSESKAECAEGAETPEEISDVETAEKMAGLLNQIMETVKDVLELSKDELEQFMEQLGITGTDLLNPVQLQELVLLVNNEQDAVSLLTDAELLTTVNELINEVQQLLQEAEVTPEELVQFAESPEFDAVLEEAVSQMPKVTDGEPAQKEPQAAEETVQAEADAAKTTTVEFKNNEDAGIEQQDVKSDGKQMISQTDEVSVETDPYAVQFTQNLQKAAEAMVEGSEDKDLAQMIREIADQILEKVKITVTPETTSLEIVLTPEELGKVNLTVSEQDGVMKARFITENELAKDAIERNLVQFKEMLIEQGLKVETIEVAVGNFEFDKNEQTGQSNAQEEKKNGKHRFVSEDGVGQAEETDQLARHFMEGGESTVNYMA